MHHIGRGRHSIGDTIDARNMRSGEYNMKKVGNYAMHWHAGASAGKGDQTCEDLNVMPTSEGRCFPVSV